MNDLEYGVGQALGEGAEDYDIGAITEALRARGIQDVDDVPAEEFWALVEEHALPELDETSDLARFQAEMADAVKTPVGIPAVWRRGGVTLEIRGHARFGMRMPQELASYRLTVAGGSAVDLTDEETFSWPRLWETVDAHLTAWAAEVSDRHAAYEQAVDAEARAAAAAREAAAAAERARRALAEVAPEGMGDVEQATMSTDEVAAYLGIASGSVRKQMSRWQIAATYERGQHRAEARYPTAEVQAKAAQRPGQGFRSDRR